LAEKRGWTVCEPKWSGVVEESNKLCKFPASDDKKKRKQQLTLRQDPYKGWVRARGRGNLSQPGLKRGKTIPSGEKAE